MKTCTKCEKSKELSEFNKNKSTKDGLQRHCKICQRENNRKYYSKSGEKEKQQKRNAKRKVKLRDFIINIRKTLKCVKCGEDRWYCLDFHHKNPDTKLYEIADMPWQGMPKSTILKEINKCDTLCANCHRELHHFENKAMLMV